MKMRHLRLTKGEKVLYTIIISLFSIYSVTLIFPFVWAFLTSLKTQQEYIENSPFALPELWKFVNYAKAFDALEVHNTKLVGMFFNSLWYSVGMVVGNVFVCSLGAYVLSRYPFKGSNGIYHAILIMMLMPIIGNGPSAFRVYGQLGLLNNPLFVISNWGIMGTNFLFLYAFYSNVSWAYAEAAFIDGAGHFKVYFKIMFPQALSIISALAIMQFVGYWNDYATPLLYFPKLPTLATGIYEYEKSMIRGANMPVYFAGLLISVVPVLILFFSFQNTVMDKISLGGLKG